MKFLIVNGSPKGEYSITLQTIYYLKRKYGQHEFIVLNAGQKIKALEKDFSEAEKLLNECDTIIFSYPVYTFIAPSQLHRFIELVKQSGVDLSGKFVSQITTSKHFYDVTAHRYIEENCYDLNMKYIAGLSADMEDLLTDGGKLDAEKYFERLLFSIENDLYSKGSKKNSDYQMTKATLLESEISVKDESKDIVIITDEEDEESNLSVMIARMRQNLKYKTRVVNISSYPFMGGCLGCFRCAVSEKCVYKDGFDVFLRENIQKADAIIYAFKISDHSMGSRFKMYDDRNFCNGHRTVTVGMPVAYLISGAYSEEENLKTIIEARADTGGNFFCGVATDEERTDEQIDDLAKTLVFALESKQTRPRSFWGVGGMKIFRDLIYEMRGMMRADHKFYKKQGVYDFPQKKKVRPLLMYLVGFLLSNEKVVNKMGNKMNEGMLAPYKKMFDKMDKQNANKVPVKK